MTYRKWYWIPAIVLLIIAFKAWMLGGILSDKSLDDTQEALASNSDFAPVSASADGLNISLTGPAEQEVAALQAVRALESTDNVSYTSTDSSVGETPSIEQDQNEEQSIESSESSMGNAEPLSSEQGAVEAADVEAALSDLEVALASGAIQFETRSAQLTAASKLSLDESIEVINAAEGFYSSVNVVGYTDTLGDEERNLALSQRRADAVVAYLVSQGISTEKLTSEGRGESDPKVFPEITEEDLEANRRIEWEILQ